MDIKPVIDKSVALVWGLAEATVFFVAAEVWVTLAVIRRGPAHGAAVAGFALIGLGVGAIALFYWGASDPEGAKAFVTAIPGVDDLLLYAAHEDIRKLDVAGVFSAPWQGLPDKAFSVQAAKLGAIMPLFVIALVLGRAMRMVLAVAVALGLKHGAKALGREKLALPAWAAAWALFYALVLAGVV